MHYYICTSIDPSMKPLKKIIFVAPLFLFGFTSPVQTDNVELSCVKNHKASNTCHFNFKIDGMKYRFVDMGCKYGRNKEEAIKKAKEGTLALAKDWKLECPEPKPEKEGTSSGSGF